jgi:hypothetical protein
MISGSESPVQPPPRPSSIEFEIGPTPF